MAVSRLRPIREVPGLYIYEDFVSKEMGDKLWYQLDNDVWENKLKRRTQHYNYDYDYNRGTSDPIPRKMWGHLITCTEHINKFVIPNQPPMDRIIVNEYTQKQGITPHIDRVEPFGPYIMSLSLGSEAVMDFYGSNGETHSFWLNTRSLVIMSGDARYIWKHGIKPNIKQEGITPDGQFKYGNRSFDWRRISVTWRSGRW